MHIAIMLAAAAFHLSQLHSDWQAIAPRLTFDYQACMGSGAARGSDEESVRCIVEEGERQDGRLNQAYRRLVRQLPSQRRYRLRAEQREWTAERDRRCGPAVRSIDAAMARADCILRRTVLRTIALERYR